MRRAHRGSIVLVSVLSVCVAQSAWTWRNPLPQGNDLFRVVAGGPGFVAFTRTGSALVSPDGLEWTVHDIGAPRGITDAVRTGERLVVIGAEGFIATSVDGQTWREAESGVDSYLHGVAWTGAVAVVAGPRGQVLSSPDGTTWTARDLPGDYGALTDVVWSGSHLAVWRRYEGQVAVSTDGIDWCTANASIGDLAGVVDFGDRTLAVASGGALFAFTSCSTFTDAGSIVVGASSTYTDVCATDSAVLAVGHGVIARCTEAIGWRAMQTCADPLGRHGFKRIHWTGEHAYAVGDGMQLAVYDGRGDGYARCGQSGGQAPSLRDVTSHEGKVVVVGERGAILTCGDGDEPALVRRGPTVDLLEVTWSGETAVAVGVGGTALVSADGIVWAAESTGVTRTLTDVLWTGSRFVAVGHGGTIVTSRDGDAWTVRSSGTDADLMAVVDAGDGVLAAGLSGQQLIACHSADDGRSWISDTLPGATIRLGGVVWDGEKAVIAADAGDIYTAPGCTTWTRSHTGIHQHVSGLIWTGEQFVLIHDWKMVATSPDGVIWTERLRQGPDLFDIVWTGSRLVAVGERGLVLTSPDGVAWTTLMEGAAGAPALHRVIWTGEHLLALGSTTVFHSTDGIAWTEKVTGSANALTSAVWTDSLFVVVGENGTILSSPVDPPSRTRPGDVRRGPAAAPTPRVTRRGARVRIQGGAPECRLEWTVWNAAGRAIMRGSERHGGIIGIGSLPAGVHLLSVTDAHGRTVRTVIVQP